MPTLSNPAMHLTDFQQAPTPNMVEKTKFDVNTSTEENTNVDQFPSCNDKKEVLVADAHINFIGICSFRSILVTLNILLC